MATPCWSNLTRGSIPAHSGGKARILHRGAVCSNACRPVVWQVILHHSSSFFDSFFFRLLPQPTVSLSSTMMLTTEESAGLQPYFDFDVQRNITVTVGQTGFLHCRVERLGDKDVSTWTQEHGKLTGGRKLFFVYLLFSMIYGSGLLG